MSTNEAVVRQWFESLNRKEPAVAETFSPDAKVHLVGQPAVQETQIYAVVVGGFLKAFPDLHFTIDALHALGDVVACHLTAHGTHQGELMGMPPTGRPVSVEVATIDRFREGKIVNRWELFDALGMMQQLGAIPIPG